MNKEDIHRQELERDRLLSVNRQVPRGLHQAPAVPTIPTCAACAVCGHVNSSPKDECPNCLRREVDHLKEELAIAIKFLKEHDETRSNEYAYGFLAKAFIERVEKTLPQAPPCDHKWVDARNKYVTSGEICLKCHAMRAGNQTKKEGE